METPQLQLSRIYGVGEIKPVVLLVDANAEALQVYSSFLKKYFLVKTDTNEEEAAATLLERQIDIAVLDVMIMKANDWHFLKWIRKHWSESALPVIALTIIESLDLEMSLIRQGANDWLSKPRIPSKVLLHSINALLGRGQA